MPTRASTRFTPAMILRRVLVLLALAVMVVMVWWSMIRMPGKSFSGPSPPLSPDELALRAELIADVRTLGGEIGERNLYNKPAQLMAAADFIESAFSKAGFRVRRDGYDLTGKKCDNIEVEIPGTDPARIIVVGAHYDSALGAPGANDNGSGVAATLALARRFAGKSFTQTLRFVAFVNEEPPWFQTEHMGSLVYARRCKGRGDQITAMISLETVGCFSDRPNSQNYPVPILGAIYPTTGNFIAFVGNTASRGLVRQALGSFRRHAQLPSEGAALPAAVPGVDWSDHWSFWQHGYPAIMITDTAPFRYRHYHESTDTPDKLDYDSMTRVVSAIGKMVEDLANAKP